MTESTTEGRSSTTTTTVLDGKNGSVHKPPLKMTKSVSQELKTTFRSPAAWILVVALIVTWSAVAIVIFDLVDYKTFADTYSQYCDDPCLPPGFHQPAAGNALKQAESLLGGPISKLRNDPVRIIHEAVDDTYDWMHAIFSTVSDFISFDDEKKGLAESPVKKIGGIQPTTRKVVHIDREEKHDKDKPIPRVIQKDRPVKEEKTSSKPFLKLSTVPVVTTSGSVYSTDSQIQRPKPEVKEKTEKKASAKEIQKKKAERKVEPKKKAPSKASEKENPDTKIKTEKKVPAAALQKETPKKEKAEKKSITKEPIKEKPEKREKTQKKDQAKVITKEKTEQMEKVEKKVPTKVKTTAEEKEKAEKKVPTKGKFDLPSSRSDRDFQSRRLLHAQMDEYTEKVVTEKSPSLLETMRIMIKEEVNAAVDSKIMTQSPGPSTPHRSLASDIAFDLDKGELVSHPDSSSSDDGSGKPWFLPEVAEGFLKTIRATMNIEEVKETHSIQDQMFQGLGLFHDNYGPSRRVLSCPNIPEPSEISKNRCLHRGSVTPFSIQSPPIRTLLSPKSIFKNYVRSHKVPSLTGDSNSSILGRLPDCFTVGGSTTIPLFPSPKMFTTLGWVIN
ncbi:triadin [Bufo bufo]|uniref:triadin n=1 Tax=Bufo bufo TaxID=8384 RepID=UPI001ABDD6D2|nr:triadin [Bufo bufo]